MNDVRLQAAGFTLLESIIVISLLGIVGLSFAYLFSSSQRFMIQSVNFTSSQNDASFALEHVKRKLMVATGVAEPATGANGNALQFAWQEIVAGVVTDRTSRYEVNGTDLRYIPNVAAPGTFEVIARGIDTLTFNRATAGTIAVDVTAEKSTGGDTRQTRLQTRVSPRGLFQ